MPASARRALVLFALAAACACSRGPSATPSTSGNQQTPNAPAAEKRSTPLPQLQLSVEKPVVGAKVHVTASGLPSGKMADLQWETVNGGWVIEDFYYFRGKKYAEVSRSLGKFPI